jgi:ABC-type glycerol-3-phosphate transport system substrate-binding protein
MTTHSRIQQLLAVYRDLNGADRHLVDEHVKTCPSCAAQLAAYREMDRDVARQPQYRPAPRLRDNVYAALAAGTPQPRRPDRFRWLSAPAIAGQAVALSVVLMLLAGLWLILRSTQVPTIMPAIAGPTVVAPTAQPVITIRLAATERHFGDYARLAREFEAANPDIKVQIIPMDTLLRGVRGRDGHTYRLLEPSWPELAAGADLIAGVALRSEDVQQGYVLDLKPFIEADASFDRADFYPGVLEAASQNGGLYMVPDLLYVRLLFFNKELWGSLGLPRSPGTSWQDVVTVAQAMAQKQGGTVERWGFIDLWKGTWQMDGILDEAGLYRSPEDLSRLDRPEVVAMMERLAALYDSGAFYPIGPDLAQFQTLIREERVGMWTGAEVGSGGATPESSLPFVVGVEPFPVNTIAVTGYVISQRTQYAEQAWRLLSFLSRRSPEDFGGNEIGGGVPVRNSVAERDGYWARLSASYPQAREAIEYALNTHVVPGAALNNREMYPHILIWESLMVARYHIVETGRPTADALRVEQIILDQLLAEPNLTPFMSP